MPSPDERREAAIAPAHRARQVFAVQADEDGNPLSAAQRSENAIAAYESALSNPPDPDRSAEQGERPTAQAHTNGDCLPSCEYCAAEHPETGERETDPAQAWRVHREKLWRFRARVYDAALEGEREDDLVERVVQNISADDQRIELVGYRLTDEQVRKMARVVLRAAGRAAPGGEDGFDLRAILGQALEGLESAHPEDYVENLREVIAALTPNEGAER